MDQIARDAGIGLDRHVKEGERAVARRQRAERRAVGQRLDLRGHLVTFYRQQQPLRIVTVQHLDRRDRPFDGRGVREVDLIDQMGTGVGAGHRVRLRHHRHHHRREVRLVGLRAGLERERRLQASAERRGIVRRAAFRARQLPLQPVVAAREIGLRIMADRAALHVS
jgi:hypothetical protein